MNNYYLERQEQLFENAWMSQVGVAIRTMLIDRAATAFIKKHPDAVVINIGAGWR